MSTFKFPALLSQGGSNVATVTAFRADSETPVYTADESHPHFNEILAGLSAGDPDVWELFDIATSVMKRFEQVTDRISWNGSEVLFDGDPIHSVLADQLGRAIQDGNSENYTALAKFWEKLESNPTAHSREQAYDFLATHAFQITPDGDVVGYKGVSGSSVEGVYHSTATSRVKGVPSAFVNGKPVPELSKVPQRVGDVVTMPRSEVVHDPNLSCHRGLHVATKSYAKSYGTVMEVHVNPRDIVSVPTADSGAKVRVCRYRVARIAPEGEDSRPVLHESAPVWAGDVGYKV